MISWLTPGQFAKPIAGTLAAFLGEEILHVGIFHQGVGQVLDAVVDLPLFFLQFVDPVRILRGA